MWKILHNETEKRFRYRPNSLSAGSHKPVVVRCDVCGHIRERDYRGAIIQSHKCPKADSSQWTRVCPDCEEIVFYKTWRSWYNNRNSNSPCRKCANKGSKNPFYGKKHTKEVREMLARTFQKWEWRRISKPEKELAEILEKQSIKYIQQYRIENRYYDFYLPDKNLLIEVDGIYWHARGLSHNEMTQRQRDHIARDKIKNVLAEKNKYELLRIWEDEIDSVSKYLFE